MANLESIALLKAEINEYITQNNSQAITGNILNDALIDMVDTIVNNYALMTEDEYDELVSKDPNLFYYTYEEE